MRMLAVVAIAGSCVLDRTASVDNGLGRTPPMGWRSWNLFGPNVDQTLMMSIMDGMVARKRSIGAELVSFCDLGYCDVGLDDNWQACGQGNNGYSFHASSGRATGPLINTDRFPDLRAMTQYAHRLGLTAGWYANNCICSEKLTAPAQLYEGDVKSLVLYGFDGVKLDYCGTQRDLDLWSRLINQTGRAIMLENCHWGLTVPSPTWCPWNYFRTSADIRASYESVATNLQTTVHWAQRNLSRPGCWAYPDMLQVGVVNGVGGPRGDPGLTLTESRSHFGAWCIVSSPLVLSFDVTNDSIVSAMWPIVANPEAIAVNQAWAGHSGSPFKQSSQQIAMQSYTSGRSGVLVGRATSVPRWQYFYKPLGGGSVAVLLMNHDLVMHDLRVEFGEVPSLACMECCVRDIWQRVDLGLATQFLNIQIASHDSAFYTFSPCRGRHLRRGQQSAGQNT